MVSSAEPVSNDSIYDNVVSAALQRYPQEVLLEEAASQRSSPALWDSVSNR